MKHLLLICGILIATSGAQASQPAVEQNPCEDQDAMMSQAGMNHCAGYEYDKAEAALNATYQTLLQSLRRDRRATSKLVASQKAWTTYRNAQCSFETIGSEGGSIHSLEISGCETGLINQRNAQLKTSLNTK